MITGTHFNYYLVCHRKLWLFAHGISMEHTSDLVFEGKTLHETAYAQRAERYKELEFGGIKIDYSELDMERIEEIKLEIPNIIEGACPNVINKAKCKKCSYCDFCYAGEM